MLARQLKSHSIRLLCKLSFKRGKMPELPEVETTLQGILPHALGQTIEQIVVRQFKLRWPIERDIGSSFSGVKVDAISRRAKYLLLETKAGDLMIHLGMSGSLRIVTDEPATKHDHVDILLSNAKTIRFNDPRRFGSLLVNRQKLAHPLLEKLGPEPLSEQFDGDYLHSAARARKVPIKSFIMNNHVVVGVGNIYAQESLFLAGIHPKRQACKVSRERMRQLAIIIKQVLAKAIEAGGSSLKDFTGADGKPGYFQQSLNVYGRFGENCLRCESGLKQATIGQRTTVYCGSCQK
jgi:formamidopyrimidine-DNA glycosylase